MKYYIIIFVLVAGLIIARGNVWAESQETHSQGTVTEDKGLGQGSSKEVKINKQLVCMINDKYMDGKEQIPVEVEGKTYYGCCQGCVAALKYKRSARYAIDPFSGKEVDKASAYIVLNPDGSKKVLYFESAGNYLKFSKQ